MTTNFVHNSRYTSNQSKCNTWNIYIFTFLSIGIIRFDTVRLLIEWLTKIVIMLFEVHASTPFGCLNFCKKYIFVFSTHRICFKKYTKIGTNSMRGFMFIFMHQVALLSCFCEVIVKFTFHLGSRGIIQNWAKLS